VRFEGVPDAGEGGKEGRVEGEEGELQLDGGGEVLGIRGGGDGEEDGEESGGVGCKRERCLARRRVNGRKGKKRTLKLDELDLDSLLDRVEKVHFFVHATLLTRRLSKRLPTTRSSGFTAMSRERKVSSTLGKKGKGETKRRTKTASYYSPT
jgi:hypothetical protein